MRAFPFVIPDGCGGFQEAESGMSLRDYFAVHADQPGVSELVAMAGGETDGFHVKFTRDCTPMKFNDWWNGLPLADRLDLSARVRFAMADAMLANRLPTSPGTPAPDGHSPAQIEDSAGITDGAHNPALAGLGRG